MKAKASQFNCSININDEASVLVNTLTGAMDIVGRKQVEDLKNHEIWDGLNENSFLCKRQYLIDQSFTEEMLAAEFFNSIREKKRKASPIKAVVILTFDCNLACTYCWQQKHVAQCKREMITIGHIDRVFDAVDSLKRDITSDGNQQPIIQLFGGEPLLYNNRDLVEHLLKGCRERGWNAQITTNGSQIMSFIDLFDRYGLGEIQITIDGPEKIHEMRRVGSCYTSTMDAVNRLLQMNIAMVKIRVNVDSDNIDGLVELADEIIDRKWFTNRRFYCYISPLRDADLEVLDLITERQTLLEKFLDLKRDYPQLEIFDVLGWNGFEAVKVLENTGRMPYPKGYICDTNMNNFVFTPGGEIHLCSEKAHESKAAVGSYWPELEINDEAFQRIYNKDAMSYEDCKICRLLPICGGGCQMFEKEKNYKVAFCQSVADCFEIGIRYFVEKEGLV